MSRARFGIDIIHHLTREFGEGELRGAVLNAVRTERERLPSDEGICAFARLTDYKLGWFNSDTVATENNEFFGTTSKTLKNTLVGVFEGFRYALVQRGDDCDVHLRQNGDAARWTDSRQVMCALLRAIAFLHGRHAWPQWQRIENGFDTTAEYTRAPRTIPRTIYTTLSEDSGGDPALLIAKAAECFLREGDFGETLHHYLFLAREASANETPHHAGSLGLCAVFEGLITFLHSHGCGDTQTPDEAEFEKARSELKRYASERAAIPDLAPTAAEMWKRFIGLIQSARPLRPLEKYRWLVEHLRLPLEATMPAFDVWKRHRNVLAHGMRPDGDNTDNLIVVSRVAGAINVMAAAALGYSGSAVLSRLEDRFVRIPEPRS